MVKTCSQDVHANLAQALQELEKRILEKARPQLQKLVESAAGQESMLSEIHLDVQNGSILGAFQLS